MITVIIILAPDDRLLSNDLDLAMVLVGSIYHVNM